MRTDFQYTALPISSAQDTTQDSQQCPCLDVAMVSIPRCRRRFLNRCKTNQSRPRKHLRGTHQTKHRRFDILRMAPVLWRHTPAPHLAPPYTPFEPPLHILGVQFFNWSRSCLHKHEKNGSSIDNTQLRSQNAHSMTKSLQSDARISLIITYIRASISCFMRRASSLLSEAAGKAHVPILNPWNSRYFLRA